MKKLELKKLFIEWFLAAFAVGFIFLFMMVFLLQLKNPLIFSICTASYTVPIVLLLFCVKKYYGKDVLLDIFEKVANPIISLILLSFLFYLFYYSFSLGVGILSLMDVVFFLVFLISFFAVASLYFLKREKHRFLTVRAIYTAKKYLKWNAIFFVLFVILFSIALDISPKYSLLYPVSIYSAIVSYYFFFSTLAMFGLNFLSYDDGRKYCQIGLKIVEEGLTPPLQVGPRWVERRLSVFETVINQLSGFAKDFYPGSPRISESYAHCKALYAAQYAAHRTSIKRRKNFLNNAKRGIKKMINSLNAGKSKKGFDFYLFLSGLVLIDRGKGTRDVEKEFREVQDAFEVYNVTNVVKRYGWLISFIAAIIPFSDIVARLIFR